MDFATKIKGFNQMYKLPVATKPALDQLGVPPIERLKALKDILREELDEIDLIVAKLINNESPDLEDPVQYSPLEILTDLADLLGDIQVYCASEMAKFGIPLDKTLGVIMDSNFSKLGADGNPIYDERGKVQKGPNYWKPEPKIYNMLFTLTQSPGMQEAAQLLEEHNKRMGTGLTGAFDPLISPQVHMVPKEVSVGVHEGSGFSLQPLIDNLNSQKVITKMNHEN